MKYPRLHIRQSRLTRKWYVVIKRNEYHNELTEVDLSFAGAVELVSFYLQLKK